MRHANLEINLKHSAIRIGNITRWSVLYVKFSMFSYENGCDKQSRC